MCVSHVQFFVIPWTVAHQALLSLEFSRQEYWWGLPFPSPGDLPNPGIEPWSSVFQDSLPSEPPGSVKACSRSISWLPCLLCLPDCPSHFSVSGTHPRVDARLTPPPRMLSLGSFLSFLHPHTFSQNLKNNQAARSQIIIHHIRRHSPGVCHTQAVYNCWWWRH